MTDEQCYAQATKDYEYLCQLFNGKSFKECVTLCKKNKFDFFHEDGELFDINYGVACFTINNENGMGVVNPNSIEVWNDSEDAWLGTYTLKELEVWKDWKESN